MALQKHNDEADKYTVTIAVNENKNKMDIAINNSETRRIFHGFSLHQEGRIPSKMHG